MARSPELHLKTTEGLTSSSLANDLRCIGCFCRKSLRLLLLSFGICRYILDLSDDITKLLSSSSKVAVVQVDTDKLVEILEERGLIKEIIGKRPGVPKLTAQLYLNLLIAAEAMGTDMGARIITALETYLIRNREKHLLELKIQASAAGKNLEEYIADRITQRLQKSKDKEE
jgi:hypothetical protein